MSCPGCRSIQCVYCHPGLADAYNASTAKRHGDWTPGQMALGYNDEWEIPVVRHRGTPDYWSAASGVWPIGVSADQLDYRRLVVIDPEEIPGALAPAWLRNLALDLKRDASTISTSLENVLLFLADKIEGKPAIEEPTGHAAVVEDREGRRWINWRDPRATGEHERPWVLSSDSYTSHWWHEIDVARVLSEGVPS